MFFLGRCPRLRCVWPLANCGLLLVCFSLGVAQGYVDYGRWPIVGCGCGVFFLGRCPRLRCVWPLAKLCFVGKAFVGNDKGVESGGATGGAAGGVGVDQDSSSELDSS